MGVFGTEILFVFSNSHQFHHAPFSFFLFVVRAQHFSFRAQNVIYKSTKNRVQEPTMSYTLMLVTFSNNNAIEELGVQAVVIISTSSLAQNRQMFIFDLVEDLFRLVAAETVSVEKPESGSTDRFLQHTVVKSNSL